MSDNKPNYNMELILDYLVENELSASDLAREADLTQSTAYRIVNGTINIKLDHIYALADAMQIDPGELLVRNTRRHATSF